MAANDLGDLKAQLVSPAFLRELHCLFGGEAAPAAGEHDAGWNCQAKAFVAASLCSTCSDGVDLCEGRLLIFERSRRRLAFVKRHHWSRVREAGIVDLSIAGLHELEFLPVFAGQPQGESDWLVQVASSEYQLAEVLNRRREPGPERLMTYLMTTAPVGYEPAEIEKGVGAAIGPVTRQILSGYRDSTLLTKAGLHLLGLLRGERESLLSVGRTEAWRMISEWSVDAVNLWRSERF